MRAALDLASRVASNNFSCLFLRGETGTGKSLFAKAIHDMSPRAGKPFVEVNCSALPSTLIESELFGHKKGSFTDAKEDKAGLFELADTGTIFLDEIGDMDLGLQAKLLHVLEEKQFRRIGDSKAVRVDVAVIAATNKNVEEQVTAGKFREDLYYRINVIPLHLPPLRSHPEDIPELCRHFVEVYARRFGKNVRALTEEAMRRLMEYTWPGNIRELRNVMERGCLLTQAETIGTDLVFFPLSPMSLTATPGTAIPAGPSPAAPMSMADAERLAIRRAMEEAQGNRNQAAKILGLHRTTLYKKLGEYGME
jgi:transcriptional regulator with PAS, ATPase and Fis domain